jgi:predicted transcriptional regulator
MNRRKSDVLQEENRTLSEFVNRTDQLAFRIGRNVDDLPEILGISRSMFYGYRSGSNRVSAKVWLKLSDAESKHVRPDVRFAPFVEREGNPKDIPSADWRQNVLSDDVAEYKVSKRPPDRIAPQNRIRLLEAQIDGITAQLAAMKETLKQLKTEL